MPRSRKRQIEASPPRPWLEWVKAIAALLAGLAAVGKVIVELVG